MEHAFFELFGRESVDVVEELIRTGELDKVLELFTELEQIVLEEEEWLRDVQTIFRKKLNAGFGFSPMQGTPFLPLFSSPNVARNSTAC